MVSNDAERLDREEEKDHEVRSGDSFDDNESERENVNVFESLQEQLFEIIESEEVEDVVDLNEKFLS